MVSKLIPNMFTGDFLLKSLREPATHHLMMSNATPVAKGGVHRGFRPAGRRSQRPSILRKGRKSKETMTMEKTKMETPEPSGVLKKDCLPSAHVQIL